jgi:hypothetical protein
LKKLFETTSQKTQKRPTVGAQRDPLGRPECDQKQVCS